MKIAFNCFIPVLQDPVDSYNLNTTGGKVSTSITSNGYYGYQPIINTPNRRDNLERMDIQNHDDIQFNNMIDVEQPMENNANHNIRNKTNRKRAWECGSEEWEKKKRRENEPNCITPINHNLRPIYANVKSPTHNIPDIPRCIMGHYI